MERHHLGVTRNALRENRLVIFGLCSIGLRRHGPFISCHIFLPLCFALSGTHLGSSFTCALLTPYKPSLTREKKPGSALFVARAPKSYCATVGIFACALLTPYKPSLTTEKKPGSALCAAKPLKKSTAAKSYYGAVGISLAGLACHILCPHLQVPPS